MTEAPKLCAGCREAMNVYTAGVVKRVYHERAAAGLCVRCGAVRAMKDRTLCSGCVSYRASLSKRAYVHKYVPKGNRKCGTCGRPGHNARRCAAVNESNAHETNEKGNG